MIETAASSILLDLLASSIQLNDAAQKCVREMKKCDIYEVVETLMICGLSKCLGLLHHVHCLPLVDECKGWIIESHLLR